MARKLPETERVGGRPGRRNRTAVERTIAGLRRGGRLEDADAGTVAVVRHLAAALDQLDPIRYPTQTASLARAQLAALRVLRGLGDDDAGGAAAGAADLLAALSAPLGDGPVG